VQVALSFLLLVGAGLFARTLGQRDALDPGFTVEGALLHDVDPGILRAPRARGTELYRRALAEVSALPGVEAATLLRMVPLSLSSAEVTVSNGGRLLNAGFNVVGPDHLRTMGIPLVAGRDLAPRDDETAPEVVVVNQTLARELFGAEDAVGRTLRFGENAPPIAIVGVAADSKTETLGEAPHPFMYRSVYQSYQGAMTLVVRARGDARALAGPVGDILRRLEPELPVAEARTLAEQLDFALLPARLGRSLLGAFGLLGLALAAVGLYGLVAYAVRRRTHEIGVRMALGATRTDVVGLVTRETAVVVAIGLAIGLALALATTRLLAAVLYGVSPSDPLTFAGATLLLIAVAALASLLPARRAARVDPMVALRHE
jgi:predicted permease